MKRFLALLAVGVSTLCAQVTVGIAPIPHQQFLDSSGRPLSGGLVYTYYAGTNTPLATFSDSTAQTQNPNPIVLDAGGSANIWINTSYRYKFVVKSMTGVTQWTSDNITTSGSYLLQDPFAAGQNQNPFYALAFNGTKYRTWTMQQGAQIADGNMGPNTQDTLTVTNSVPLGSGSAVTGSYPLNASQAVAGYAQTFDNRVGAIGVFGTGFCSGSNTLSAVTSCWGANFMGNTTSSQYAQNESVFASEMDLNVSTPHARNAVGVFLGGGSQYQPDYGAMGFWIHQYGPAPTGIVNRTGTAVTLVSGSQFDPNWTNGTLILIGGVSYTISHVNSQTSLTLVTAPGSGSNVAYTMGTLVPFLNGYYAEDGTATNWANMGALYQNGTLYPSSDGQYLKLHSRNAGNDESALIQLKADGHLVIATPGFSTGVSGEVGGVNVAGGPLTVTNGYVQYPSYTFSGLPAQVAGAQVYCSDCSTTATCTGSGTGHMAVSNGTIWKCQ